MVESLDGEHAFERGYLVFFLTTFNAEGEFPLTYGVELIDGG
jgi:hypothetical protein